MKPTLGQAPEPLLEFLGVVTIPATTETFVARDRFVVDTGGREGRVKISYLGKHFRAWFLGAIEEPTGEAALRYATLRRHSVDGPVLDELGETPETMLVQMFVLLGQQPNGESGVLLTDGLVNIFHHVKDATGLLRAVHVLWHGDGWHVYAPLAFSGPDLWYGGYRIFSRNSLGTRAACK